MRPLHCGCTGHKTGGWKGFGKRMGLNLADCVELSANLRPEKEAIVFDGLRLSYADVAGAARRVANVLRELGVRRGDRVAMMVPNLPQFPIIYFGILYAGATVVPLNVMLKQRELRHQLLDSGARVLFAFEDCVAEAAPAFADAPECAHMVVVEPGMMPGTPVHGHSFMALLSSASADFDMVQTNPEDAAVILYTSATRGTPMGAVLTHFSLFQNACSIREHMIRFRPDDVFGVVLPLFHAFGQTTMMNAPLLSQSTLVLFPRFDPGKVLEAIGRERITLLAMVPTMVAVLAEHRPAESFDMSSLRSAISGGAAMDLNAAAAFEKRFGLPVLEGYGLTETSPVVAFNKDVESNRPGSVGRALWGVRVAIRRDDGAFAGVGETGEVVVRGHGLLREYWNNPEETAAVMRDDWFHTGDLGHLDADGYVHLTGLKKDLIIRTGLNVYPRELELVLESHPAVAEAGVAGVKDALRGEEVRAWVVLRSDCPPDPTVKELGAYCRAELAVYKVPKRIEVVDALPRLPDGGVDKAALRAWGAR